METNKYPEIEKPWKQFYAPEALRVKVPEKSMYDQIREINAYHPDATALHYFFKKYTYRDFFNEVEKTARAFYNVGVRAGDIVDMLLPNIPENVVCVYALNYLGAAANMVDLRSQGELMKYYLKETGAKVAVICDIFAENVIDVLPQSDLETVILVGIYDFLPQPLRALKKGKDKKKLSYPETVISWKKFINNTAQEPQHYQGNGSEIALILHTSGTTGRSKGVKLSSYAVNALSLEYRNTGMDYSEGDVFLNQVPPFLAYNIVLATHLPLCLGLELRLLPDYRPDLFAKNITKIKPNHVVAGPADWLNFLEDKKSLGKDYSFLKTLASGSDKIPVEKKREVNKLLADRGCRFHIIEGYGLTEVGSAACTNLPHHDVYGSVGVPLPLMNFCIWDEENNTTLPYNQPGEICISGASVMQGYYDRPDDTNEVLRLHSDGIVWMHTGDMGHISKEGNIYLEGRFKRIIVRHDGMKVSPYQVEDILMHHANVQNCCVVGKDDDKHGHGSIPVAYVVLQGTSEENDMTKKLTELCQRELEEIYRPVAFYYLESLPLTPNGKVDYRKLEN